MTNSQRLAKVRARFIRWIADQEPSSEAVDPSTEGGNASAADSSILRETLLIRDEFLCGRRFYSANHFAVWFMEEDELKIYRHSGELLCVLSGSELEEGHSTGPAKQGPTILKMPNRDAQSAGSKESTRRAA